MSSSTVYGIASCDTVRRARAWLAAHDVELPFHDFKKSGLSPESLDAWIAAVGWQRLLNRQGTTWRRLDDATKSAVTDAASARALMLAQPSVIKRPVVVWADGSVSVGFDADEFSRR